MQGHDRRSRSRGRPSKRCKYGIPPYDSLKEGTMTCCGNCNEEPVLGDLLDDPIIALLMARDGITRPEVEKLMDEFALRRGM
jgi:hypothetical protein